MAVVMGDAMGVHIGVVVLVLVFMGVLRHFSSPPSHFDLLYTIFPPPASPPGG
jgi:hypothetical protein